MMSRMFLNWSRGTTPNLDTRPASVSAKRGPGPDSVRSSVDGRIRTWKGEPVFVGILEQQGDFLNNCNPAYSGIVEEGIVGAAYSSLLTDDTVVCRSVEVGDASPFFYSSVKVALNGVEYGEPQFLRYYDQPSLFLELLPVTGGPIAGGTIVTLTPPANSMVIEGSPLMAEAP